MVGREHRKAQAIGLGFPQAYPHPHSASPILGRNVDHNPPPHRVADNGYRPTVKAGVPAGLTDPAKIRDQHGPPPKFGAPNRPLPRSRGHWRPARQLCP